MGSMLVVSLAIALTCGMLWTAGTSTWVAPPSPDSHGTLRGALADVTLVHGGRSGASLGISARRTNQEEEKNLVTISALQHAKDPSLTEEEVWERPFPKYVVGGGVFVFLLGLMGGGLQLALVGALAGAGMGLLL